MVIGANILALVLAIGFPLTLILSRAVIRNQRGGYLSDLLAVLDPPGRDGPVLPMLELVRSKYSDGHKSAAGSSAPGLALTVILFAMLSFMGWAVLLVPKACLLVQSGHGGAGLQALHFAIDDAFLWVGGAGPTRDETVTIASAAFLGAYVTASQTLVRRLLNYELSAMAFVRASFQLFLGVVVAVIGFRSLSPLPGIAAGTLGLSAAQLADAGPPAAGFWLGCAFLVGLAPEAGLSWIASQLKLRLQKSVNLNALKTAEIIPIELIDGIDSGVRFRLEDNNILDVQNLATRNPVELCVETPYGLLEIFDWVLQAQLCTVVGAAAFDRLKDHNVRTIFDLERAVLADDAPPAYISALGEVIYSEATPAFRQTISQTPGGPLDPDIVRHGVAVICDDLHVHRLRALWQRILQHSTPDGDAPWLYRRGALPGDRFPIS